MSLTRERIEAEPWIGEQRAEVMGLLADRDGARAKVAVLEAECTRRAGSEAELRVEVERLTRVLGEHVALVERLQGERDHLVAAARAAADKHEPMLVDAFVSRDLVQRAFEVLTEDIARLPTAWQLRRVETLLREALAR